MIVPIASILALASYVSAVPFKRYDNATETIVTAFSSSAEVDTTITINKYVTITLPSTTLTLDASATAAIASAEKDASPAAELTVTSVITKYSTLTIGGSEITTPVSTVTSIYKQGPTTTSTITTFVTITQSYDSMSAEAATGEHCIPATVTVTVTEQPSKTDAVGVSTITDTITTSYPVVAEFTINDLTTTITSYVEVTSYETSLTTLASSSIVPVNGTSGGFQRLRRGLLFDF